MRSQTILLILIVLAFSCTAQQDSNMTTLSPIIKKELGSTIATILENNKDAKFIESFQLAQEAWEKSILMDMDLQYPIDNEKDTNEVNEYCRSIYLHYQINSRKIFLMQLANGNKSEDGCFGKTTYPKRKRIIKTKLDTVLAQDTIIFDKSYSISDFLGLLNTTKGVIKLRNLPKGNLAHFITIDSDTLARNLARIDNGLYQMTIQYPKENIKNAVIKKTIRVKDVVALKENEALPKKRL